MYKCRDLAFNRALKLLGKKSSIINLLSVSDIDYNCISDKELYDRPYYIGYSGNARVIEKAWKVVLNAEG